MLLLLAAEKALLNAGMKQAHRRRLRLTPSPRGCLAFALPESLCRGLASAGLAAAAYMLAMAAAADIIRWLHIIYAMSVKSAIKAQALREKQVTMSTLMVGIMTSGSPKPSIISTYVMFIPIYSLYMSVYDGNIWERLTVTCGINCDSVDGRLRHPLDKCLFSIV